MTLEEMLRNVAGETMVNRLHSGELQPVTETTQISDAVHDQADAADLAARRRAGLLSYGRQALGFMPHVQGATWSPDEKRAFLTSAVDPFGATSGLLDRFSPGTGEALRAQYTGHPIEAATGGMATPMPGVNMLRGLTSARNLVKTLPLGGVLAAMLGDGAYGADEKRAKPLPGYYDPEHELQSGDTYGLSPKALQDRMRQVGLERLRREMNLDFVSPGLRGGKSLQEMKMYEIRHAVPRRAESSNP